MGFDGTQKVSTGLSFLTPSSLLFNFNFYLSKEANGPNFKPKLLVRVPKVSHHHIHDWNLINLGSIDLHHSLSIALPRLQQERHRDIENRQSGKQKYTVVGPFYLYKIFHSRLPAETGTRILSCQVLRRHSGGRTHGVPPLPAQQTLPLNINGAAVGIVPSE